jgi:2-keto-3-deoxy-L-rhamnonate aldolase RhmA
MRPNRFRQLLNDGKPTLGTRVQSVNPTITELIGRSGNYDYVEFLAEYAPYTLHDLDNLGRAIELSPNFSGLIKMEKHNQAWLAVRAVAAGITNLLFTDLRSAEDARECVRLIKPEVPGSVEGATHGNAGGRSAIGGADAIIQGYRDSVIVVMIEKKGAIDELEQICQVPGIDMVQFGPSDYSWSIGIAGQRMGKEVIEAREYTIHTALKYGVRPRAEISDASEVEYYTKLGVKDFCMAPETGVLSRYYANEGGAVRKALGG